ncbi:MAG: hypothetical protein ACRYHQ_23780 [Janthinobacterium lividum]
MDASATTPGFMPIDFAHPRIPATLCIAASGPDGAETDIVHDVGFSALRGEMVTLIGESGSDKTTRAWVPNGPLPSPRRPALLAPCA